MVSVPVKLKHQGTHMHCGLVVKLTSTSSHSLIVGCWEFYVVVTSKVIPGWVPTCNNVHSWRLYSAVPLGNQCLCFVYRFVCVKRATGNTMISFNFCIDCPGLLLLLLLLLLFCYNVFFWNANKHSIYLVLGLFFKSGHYIFGFHVTMLIIASFFYW